MVILKEISELFLINLEEMLLDKAGEKWHTGVLLEHMPLFCLLLVLQCGLLHRRQKLQSKSALQPIPWPVELPSISCWRSTERPKLCLLRVKTTVEIKDVTRLDRPWCRSKLILNNPNVISSFFRTGKWTTYIVCDTLKIWFWTPDRGCRFFSVSVFRMNSKLIVYDAIRSFPPDCMTEDIGKFFGIGTSQITLLENVPNYIQKAYWNETKQSY